MTKNFLELIKDRAPQVQEPQKKPWQEIKIPSPNHIIGKLQTWNLRAASEKRQGMTIKLRAEFAISTMKA